MKVAIVGSGWLGCHLASKFKQNNDVTVYEKNETLFSQTSYNNQNRLHCGYHYARNYKTRELCQSTYDRFMQDYGFLTSEVPRNYYCVADNSVMDYQTYLQIFKGFNKEEINFPLLNVQGTINTKERYIDFQKAHQYFNNSIGSITVKKNIEDLSDLTAEYELVLNCTNNSFPGTFDNSFFELTLTLIYTKTGDVSFDAITLVDGNFFSIYPYSIQENKFTLTDVEHTPLKSFTSIEELEAFHVTSDIVEQRRLLMEEKVERYFPSFNGNFEYSGYFLSTKAKSINSTADRYPVVRVDGNIVHAYTGKIQGIYPVQDLIQSFVG